MNTTNTNAKSKSPRSLSPSSAELRQRIEATEDAARAASRLLDEGEPGAAEAFDAAEAEGRRLRAQLPAALQREAAALERDEGDQRRMTAARLIAESAALSLDVIAKFNAESAQKGRRLEEEVVSFFLACETRVGEANATRDRIKREAEAAGVSVQLPPVWTMHSCIAAVGVAIHGAHVERAEKLHGQTSNLRLKRERSACAIEVGLEAERARELIEPRRPESMGWRRSL
jgi:hypothetical protein